MSTETPVRTSLRAGLRLAPVEIVLTRRMLLEMWKITRWFWPAAVVVVIVVGIAIAQYTPVTRSIWENATHWPRWWLYAMAVALVAGQLPLVVLHGVTRRAALRSAAVGAVLASFGWAVFIVVGHVLEKLVYGWLGWPATLNTPHLFADGYDVLPMLIEYWLLFLGYVISGALSGAVFYRYGWLRGILLLVPALLPAAALEILLATGFYGESLQEMLGDRPSGPVLVLGSLAVLGLAALANYLVLRDVPIGNKK